NVANSVVAQLLFLEAEDSTKDISIYINSPGGSITAGMAIYDTMNFINADVSTIATGMAASMGAFLLAAGEKGKRYALLNSEVMIHQPLGVTQDQADENEIHANRILDMRHKINELLAERSRESIDVVAKDTNLDNYMSAQAAADYGLIDKDLTNKK